jgi:hypothetical protein
MVDASGMKAFIFAFVVYLAILSVQPCQDLIGGVRRDSEAVTVLASGQDQEIPTSGEQEECSPFCICSCRQAPTAFEHAFLPLPHDLIAAAASQPASHYKASHTSNPDNSIWQPPKFKSIA